MPHKTLKSGGIKLRNRYLTQNSDLDEIHKQAITFFIQNSTIQLLTDHSTYGIIYTLHFQKQPHESPFVRITNDSHHTDVLVIIAKICLIDDDTNKTWYDNKKSSTSFDSFVHEITTQQHIFLHTISQYDPICPAIINFDISSLPSLFLQIYQKSDSITFNSLHKIDVQDNTYGIIYMEFADNFKPLEFFPDNDYYNNLARYQIIQLAKLGFNHLDFHKGNIMIDPNYHGFLDELSGKAILIDFGLTLKIEPLHVHHNNYCHILNTLFQQTMSFISDKDNFVNIYDWINCHDNEKIEFIDFLRQQQIDNILFEPLNVDQFFIIYGGSTNTLFQQPSLIPPQTQPSFIKPQIQNQTSLTQPKTQTQIQNQPSLTQPKTQTQIQNQPSLTQPKTQSSFIKSQIQNQPSLTQHQTQNQPSLTQHQTQTQTQNQPSLVDKKKYPKDIIEESFDDINYVNYLLNKYKKRL